jgi:hypothetical protein
MRESEQIDDRGEVPEWSKGADCKSVGGCLRWFKSTPRHHGLSGSSSVGRASAFQAEGREFEPRLPLQTEKQCFVANGRPRSSVGRARPW